MKLKIERQEYIKKTFRLNLKLIDEMYKICDQKNITMNELVDISIRYTIENLDSTGENERHSKRR